MTDLAGTQLSNLLETLPGIAKVLRSPVADAIVALVKAASGQAAFNAADVEELMKFAVRRNLMNAEESDRVLLEARQAMAGILPPPPPPKPKPAAPVAAARPAHHMTRPVAKPPARPAAKPSARKPVKAAPAKAKSAAKKAKPAPRSHKSSKPAHKK